MGSNNWTKPILTVNAEWSSDLTFCARWISDLRALSEMDFNNQIACERNKYLEVNDAQTLLGYFRNK